MQSVEVFVGGYGILPYPRHPLKSSHRIHRIHGSFWRRIFSHRIHRIHGSFWRRIFSHRIHRIHRSFWRRIFSHGIHGMLGCVIGSVGMAGCHTLLICAHLCLSVGGTSLPECSVCSACSVGHSLPVCLVMSVVVFSHGIHRWLGCVIGGVGMAGMPYPPNLCASVPICGRHFSARRFCVFRVFCGTLSLFALLVHLWAAYLRWFPSAARSDSVRHPIRLRSPSNQIASATRSGSVRCTMP